MESLGIPGFGTWSLESTLFGLGAGVHRMIFRPKHSGAIKKIRCVEHLAYMLNLRPTQLEQTQLRALIYVSETLFLIGNNVIIV